MIANAKYFLPAKAPDMVAVTALMSANAAEFTKAVYRAITAVQEMRSVIENSFPDIGEDNEP